MTRKLHYLATLIIFTIIIAFFSNCVSPDEPAVSLSDLQITNGPRFVAYYSPNRYLRPDTIHANWKYTGSNGDAVKATITILFDTTIIPVSILTATDNVMELHWVPGTDSEHFSYFGDRNCILTITSDESETTLTSDTLIVTGPLPLSLDHPASALTHSMNDTLYIRYRINNDRISQIRIFYDNNTITPDWIEHICDPSETVSHTPSPLTAYVIPFVPSTADTDLTNHPEEPIRLLLKDYGSDFEGSEIVSEEITLTE